MLSDIVIAQAAKMLPIAKVAEKLGLTDEDLIPYGRYKAKINHKLIHSDRPDGKRHQPHPCWRGQNHHQCWPGGRPERHG